ncbi:hypothetical protein FRC06_003201, partial [Ceratobasidium sp. 370]
SNLELAPERQTGYPETRGSMIQDPELPDNRSGALEPLELESCAIEFKTCVPERETHAPEPLEPRLPNPETPEPKVVR